MRASGFFGSVVGIQYEHDDKRTQSKSRIFTGYSLREYRVEHKPVCVGSKENKISEASDQGG